MNRQPRGFTLVELMIALAIFGILAAVAYPAYLDHVRSGNRADAKATLVAAQTKMETYANGNEGSYVGAVAGTQFPDQSPESGTANYTLKFSEDPTQWAYTIQAVPQGPQASDRCGTLAIDQADARTADDDNCW